MVRNGFEHRQYSGYVSTERLSYADTYDLISDLKRKCPWIAKCTNKLDITDYMAESDALEFVTGIQDATDSLSID